MIVEAMNYSNPVTDSDSTRHDWAVNTAEYGNIPYSLYGGSVLGGRMTRNAQFLPAVDATDLAAMFIKVLRKCIGPHALGVVVNLNRTSEYDGCCASHDFCDANVVMQDAFLACGLPDPSLFHGVHDCGLATDELWNMAWDLARAAEFDASKITRK